MSVPERYRSPPQAPPVFTATPETIMEEAKKLNVHSKEILDKMVADVTAENATFSSSLRPILVDDNGSGDRARVLTFYQHVSPDAALRTASSQAEELLDEYGIEARMREDVFQRIEGAFQRRTDEKINPEELRILEQYRQKFVHSGLLLPVGKERDRFKDVQKRLSQLCIQSQKNLNEESGGVWFTKEEIEGIPSDDVDVDKLDKGTGENEGKFKLTFKYNQYYPSMKYAIHENTRKRYNIADCNKGLKNVKNFHEIITLRDEAARILGMDNHAAVRLAAKMAKNPETVNKFLGKLKDGLLPGVGKESERLRELKEQDLKKRGEQFDGNLYMWDSSFYSRILKENEFSVDEQAISQYYPLEQTFTGMLKIFEEIFGLVFVEQDKETLAKMSPTKKAEDMTWHPEVRMFTVWDDEASGSAFNGFLYIDLYPRDGKYGHNANFGLEAGYIKEDGSRHYPATALVCNFSKPSKNKPALLRHGDFVTMFHELGHGIHDLVARTQYSYTHGTATTADFVEAPSQMLENWCWTPNVLKSLSSHWDTKEQIPDELINNLIKTKNFMSTTFNLNQIVIGMFDMAVHSPESHEKATSIDAGKVWNHLRHDLMIGVKGPEDIGEGWDWGQRYADIGHFIGGYDAGYYGYLYSLVFSTDMFATCFKENPMDHAQGRRYRHTVLERGGSKDEMEVLKEFLGREPSLEPFYKEIGLA